MSIFSDLRAVASLSRSLRRLADEAEAVRIQLGFRSLAELRELAKVSAKEQAAREARDQLGRPDPDDFEPTEQQIAFQDIRDRLRRGEQVDDIELLAASRALEELEGTSDTSNVEY